MSTNHRTIIESFYEHIWNRHDKSFIPLLLTETFTFRGSLGQVKQGRAEFASYVDFVHMALGNYQCDILDLVNESNKVFARMLFSGIHKGVFFDYHPTLMRVEWAGAALFTFDQEKIADLWVLGDVHSLLEQLARHNSQQLAPELQQ
ncbi:MAG: ester cyclase [Anaerolineales bacterium]|nr:ester cyclase [Anaerolineales bacterium]